MPAAEAAAAAGRAAAAASFNRPQAAGQYYSVSQAVWDDWLDDYVSGDTTKHKAASRSLRKYHAAWRIVETSDGVDCEVPCSWCSRPPPLGNPCRILSGSDEACAFCRVKGKSACSRLEDLLPAPLPPPPPPLPIPDEHRVAALEQQNKALEAQVETLTTRLAALEAKVGKIDGNVGKIYDAYKAMKDKVKGFMGDKWTQ